MQLNKRNFNPAGRQVSLRDALATAQGHHEAGRLPQAEAVYRDILKAIPSNAVAMHYLGVCIYQQGRHEDGLAMVRKCLAIKGDYDRAWFNLGCLLIERGRRTEAIEALRRCVEHKPDDAVAVLCLADQLRLEGDLDAAATAYRRTLELKPGQWKAHCDLGDVLAKKGDWDQARLHFDQARQLSAGIQEARKPLAGTLHNAAFVLNMMGRRREALEASDWCMALDDTIAEAHLNRGLTLLYFERFAEGWREYEWRGRCDSYRSFDVPRPKWDGSNLNGRRILLCWEQGFGDNIQCIRYAAMVAAKGGRVVLECQPALVRLFRTAAGVEQIVPSGGEISNVDVYAPLMSLPGLFDTTLENLPRQTPYLHADSADVQAWSQRLGARDRFRVGLVWSCHPQGLTHQSKSISLASLQPLLRIPGIAFYGLQVGEHAAGALKEFGEAVHDLAPHINDFADTAAALTQMDMLISVDTAAAHLGGAMAVKTWTLLPYAADWRWLPDRQDSPWYPTMRLFRQDRPGEWTAAIARMEADLREEVARHQRRI